MDYGTLQPSPMHGIEKSWGIENLDQAVLYGKVVDTMQEGRTNLWKMRNSHIRRVGIGRRFRFAVGDVIFKIPAAFATQTSNLMRRKLVYFPKTIKNIDVRIHGDVPPYVFDRIVEFWVTHSLCVEQRKAVCHASKESSDPDVMDVTNTMTSMAVFLFILRLAHSIGDGALFQTALAAARHRVVKVGLETAECLDCIKIVYTEPGHCEEERQIILTAALRMRSSLTSPGPARDGMAKVLENKYFADDWRRATEWAAQMM